jgi:hypothetical protein
VPAVLGVINLSKRDQITEESVDLRDFDLLRNFKESLQDSFHFPFALHSFCGWECILKYVSFCLVKRFVSLCDVFVRIAYFK